MRVSHLNASPRPGGAMSYFVFLSPIRRGGVPSGAAVFIVTGSIEVQTLISYLDYPIFMVPV